MNLDEAKQILKENNFIVEKEQLNEALNFVKKVFCDSEGEEEGELVKNLVKEIRSKKYYVPEFHHPTDPSNDT